MTDWMKLNSSNGTKLYVEWWWLNKNNRTELSPLDLPVSDLFHKSSSQSRADEVAHVVNSDVEFIALLFESVTGLDDMK